jgi:hypothetical protein
MIDFKDAQLRVGVSIGKGIEARAQQYILAKARGERAAEMIFRVAATGDYERAEREREGPVQVNGSSAQFTGIGRAKNWNGDRIGEDDRRVVKLMRGAAEGNAECGSRWSSLLHRL